MEHTEDVIDFLKTDALKYIVHLKMIDAYAEQMVCHTEREGNRIGILLLLPTRVNSFDAKTYPQAEFVVLLATNDPAVLQQIIPFIPTQTNLVFKLVDDLSKHIVLQHFPSQRVTAFVSYTTQDTRFQPKSSVVTSTALDERVIPFYQENGYTPQELQNYFRHGAMSFTVFDDAEPLATCFTFRNYETIWEIGGVSTHPSHRRQGLAHQVVETALYHVLSQGDTPRYQGCETNGASLRLAESFELKPFVTTEHFLYAPKRHADGVV